MTDFRLPHHFPLFSLAGAGAATAFLVSSAEGVAGYGSLFTIALACAFTPPLIYRLADY
jgi:hypothetical protein